MGWMGGAGGWMQVRSLPSRGAGLPRARLEKSRGAGAGKGSKEGEGRSEGLPPMPRAAVTGRNEESLSESGWCSGDVGSEARCQRRHEEGQGQGGLRLKGR